MADDALGRPFTKAQAPRPSSFVQDTAIINTAIDVSELTDLDDSYGLIIDLDQDFSKGDSKEFPPDSPQYFLPTTEAIA
jgi:hypothetical protein